MQLKYEDKYKAKIKEYIMKYAQKDQVVGQKMAELNKKNQSKMIPQKPSTNGKVAKTDSSQIKKAQSGAADNLSETSLGN